MLVLCDGWAFHYLQLADGRRQILSFLLPGDLLSPLVAVRERSASSTMALTDLQLTGLRRAEICNELRADTGVALALAEALADALSNMAELAAALGRCSAEERVAYLILHLARRTAAQSIVRDERYRFPLRQQHIADALGLTSVHVSRTMRQFQDRGLIRLSGGFLEICDRRELERIGLWL